MPEYRRRLVPGGTFFFTYNLLNRRRHLLVENVDTLRDAFRDVMKDHPFTIDAMVVLPEHLHSIWTLPAGETDYSSRWRQIKSAFSRKIPKGEAVSRSRQRKGERGIWQRRGWEHAIVDMEDYIRHVEYIHYNPVKHGHVTSPVDWPFSSIHQYIKDGILTPDWGASNPPPDIELNDFA